MTETSAQDSLEVTAPLAAFFSELRLDDVPHDVVRRGKYLCLDALGCALSGVGLPAPSLARAAVHALEEGGSATVWGTGTTATPHSAAMLNGTATQAWEMDDYHLLGPLHVGSVVVPAAVATAESLGEVAGAELLSAILCGQEIGPRVGMALGGLSLLARGWHNGAVYGTIAAGAAAGRIRGLKGTQFEHSLALAATQACGLMAAQFEAMVTYMHHGFAARAGVLAAALAETGFTGQRRVIEREYAGMGSTFAGGEDVDYGLAVSELGHRWEVTRIAVKPYACMAGIHLPIEGAMTALRDSGAQPADVDHVVIDVPEWLHRKGGHLAPRPMPVVAAQMSVPYGVAVALLDGAALPQQYSAERVDADDIHDLAARVRLVHDPAMDDVSHDDRFACRMRVVFRDGRTWERHLRHPLGSHHRPLSDEDIVTKFDTVVAGVLEAPRRDQLKAVMLGLEEFSSAALVELLADPVADK